MGAGTKARQNIDEILQQCTYNRVRVSDSQSRGLYTPKAQRGLCALHREPERCIGIMHDRQWYPTRHASAAAVNINVYTTLCFRKVHPYDFHDNNVKWKPI